MSNEPNDLSSNDPGSSDLSSAERARWLAALAQAIEDAQRVAWQLGVAQGNNDEAKQLYAQLEAAREEVESLRLGGWGRHEVDLPPLWLQSLLGARPIHDLLD